MSFRGKKKGICFKVSHIISTLLWILKFEWKWCPKQSHSHAQLQGDGQMQSDNVPRSKRILVNGPNDHHTMQEPTTIPGIAAIIIMIIEGGWEKPFLITLSHKAEQMWENLSCMLFVIKQRWISPWYNREACQKVSSKQNIVNRATKREGHAKMFLINKSYQNSTTHLY